MLYLSQKNPAWKDIKLGTCSKDTIGSSGCFVTSLGMLADITPDVANKMIMDGGGYVDGCNIGDPYKIAEILGLNYEGKTTEYQNDTCIAETNHYAASGVPQHFFIWLGNGRIVDSLTGVESENKYKIVSFRLFRPKGVDMGFSDEHMRALIENDFRAQRQNLLGSVDEKGLQSDVDFRLSQIKDGSVHAAAEQHNDYMKAKDLKWMKKADCDKKCDMVSKDAYELGKSECVCPEPTAEVFELKAREKGFIKKNECKPCEPWVKQTTQITYLIDWDKVLESWKKFTSRFRR
jgi:hypothetical protein